jgi:hypothetical protein
MRSLLYCDLRVLSGLTPTLRALMPGTSQPATYGSSGATRPADGNRLSGARRVGTGPFMRHWVVISAVGHVTAILLAVLFTGANPFDSVATEAIAVDIISPGEVPQPQTNAPETPPGPPQESPPEFDPLFDPALTPQPSSPSTATKSSRAGKPVQQTAQARPREQRGGSPSPSAAPRAATKPPPAAPAQALPLQTPPPASQETRNEANQAATQGTDQVTNVAGLFGMPLTLPDGRLGGGFDAPAIETAKIERSAVDALRAHLKTCTALPVGISPTEKISLVVRVKLNADGTLAGPPTLIEASASAKGPLLLQSLLSGLAKCQPYNMLPADKYQEWKSIDMRFTPNDMGQV